MESRWKTTLRYAAIALTALLAAIFIAKALYDAWWLDETIKNMGQQAFPPAWKYRLAFANTVLLGITGISLLLSLRHPSMRLWAVGASIVLQLGYTWYTERALIGWFARTPCACIGWWDGLTWRDNLLVNICMLLVAAGLLYTPSKRKEVVFT